MKKLFLCALAAATLLNACRPAAYVAPNFEQTRAQHHTAAILPFDAMISPKRMSKNVTPEVLAQMEEKSGYALQNAIYAYFLRETAKKRYVISFQDIDASNAMLAQKGLTYEDIRDKSKAELCRLLDVDVVVSGKVEMDQPMSEAAAIAVGMVFNFWGNTNRVSSTVSIHDQAGKLLWKYNHSASGSVGSDAQTLSRRLMRKAAKCFPYRK